MEDSKVVVILYTNYRGDRASRKIKPERIYFGSSQWYPEEQWLLDALDLGKGEPRSFAIKDIESWTPVSERP